MRISLAVFTMVAVLVGCDNNDTSALEKRVSDLTAQLEQLQTQYTALETRLAAAETAVAANGAALTDAETTLTATAELLTLMAVEDGDVVVEGANLRVRWGDLQGKGNVIIGNDAPRGECVGGAAAGRVCGEFGGYECTDGACETVADPGKTGHHNLVVGDGHRYPSIDSIVGGRFSTVAAGGAVLSGQNNSAEYFNAVLGGQNNVAAERFTAVLGGEDQTTSSEHETIPPIP